MSQEPTPMSLLVGLDHSAAGEDALYEAFRIAIRMGKVTLHIAHVISDAELITEPGEELVERQAEILTSAPKEMKKRIAAIAPPEKEGVTVNIHVTFGEPVEALQQLAVDLNADMIIIGSHQRRGFAKFLLGSVAQKMVQTSRCPVLVARPKDYEGLEKTPDMNPEPPRDTDENLELIDRSGLYSRRLTSWRSGGGNPTGQRIV